MTETAGATDKGIGLTALFGLLALLGAVVMYVGAPDQLAAWGFAAAITFGTFAIVAIHVFES